MSISVGSVGDMLREWRGRRRFSQLDLSADASVSTRHLSFVESGRSAASRDLLLRLAEGLSMPLRERNRLLLAGGYAPAYPERPFETAESSEARAAVEAVLVGHEPFPALAVDRRWNLVFANAAFMPLLGGVDPALLVPPVNVLKLCLDPGGLASRIENLPECRHHLLRRVRAQADAAGDPALLELLAELAALPVHAGRAPPHRVNPVAIPFRIRDPISGLVMSFLSTTTVFGAATEVLLSELTLECFFPADPATRAALLNPVGGPP